MHLRTVRSLRRFLPAALLTLLVVADAGAQQRDTTAAPPPPARPRDPATASLFERLRAARTLAAVDSIGRAVGDDNPLRRALVLDRRHEMTGELAEAQRAFDLYYEVASRDTSNAWAFFGIGRMVHAREAVLFERPGLLDELLPPRRLVGALGLEPQSRAQQAMLRALVLDPTIQRAALMIADMAVVSMDPLELEIAARALDYVTQRADAAPEVWLALSRIRSLMADVDAANAAALTAMAGGADASLSMISAAAALLTQRITEDRGARVYLEGTRVLSEEGADRYYRDLEQILDADDRRTWNSMDEAERGAWIRRYWDVRAGLAGVSVGRSLGEHYRRIAQADRLYGGEYGEPTPVEQMLGTGDHFPDVIRTAYTQPLEYVYDFYQFRGDADSTAVTVALAVPTDQLRPMLTDTMVVYGMNVSFILVDTTNAEVSRVDTTLYYSAARETRDAWLRSYIEVAQIPRDRVVYRLVVGDAFDPRTGALFGGPIEMRDFREDAIQMSDIVLTRADQGRWTRGGLTFPLTPAQSFATVEPITIFYEIYNLVPDARYRTEVRVVPAVRGLVDRMADIVNPGSRSLRVAFESSAPATGGPVQEVRTIQVPLRPDAYLIEVTVTDLASGRTASAVSRMTLVEAEAD